jgi:hypothetical protein
MPAMKSKLLPEDKKAGPGPLRNRRVSFFTTGRLHAGSAQASRAAAAMLGLAGPLVVGVMTGHLRAGTAAALGGLALGGNAKGATPGEQTPALIYALAAGSAAMLTGSVLAGHTPAAAFGIPAVAAAAGLIGSISRPLARATTQYILYTIIAANLGAPGARPFGLLLFFLLGACWTAALFLLFRPLFKAMGRGPDRPVPPNAFQPPEYTARQRLRRWLKSLTRLSGWHYVLRISVCLTAAAVSEWIWPLHHGYWVSITVVIVVQRNLQTALRRAFHRAAGTVLGVLLISLLLLGSPPMWALLLIIAALAAARPILLETNYTAYATIMTPLVVLLLDFGQTPSWTAVVDRLAATLAGCGLALALGYLGWSRLSSPARNPVSPKAAPAMQSK